MCNIFSLDEIGADFPLGFCGRFLLTAASTETEAVMVADARVLLFTKGVLSMAKSLFLR